MVTYSFISLSVLFELIICAIFCFKSSEIGAFELDRDPDVHFGHLISFKSLLNLFSGAFLTPINVNQLRPLANFWTRVTPSEAVADFSKKLEVIKIYT